MRSQLLVPKIRQATLQIDNVQRNLSELLDGERKPLSRQQLNAVTTLIESCQTLLKDLHENFGDCYDATEYDFANALSNVNDEVERYL